MVDYSCTDRGLMMMGKILRKKGFKVTFDGRTVHGGRFRISDKDREYYVECVFHKEDFNNSDF